MAIAAPDVDEVEYRFADRHLAARAWSIAAALCTRHPNLSIAMVHDQQVPLLIAFDPVTDVRVQFELVAWLGYVDDETGEFANLYWDQVFAASTHDVVAHLEEHTDLGPVCEPTD